MTAGRSPSIRSAMRSKRWGAVRRGTWASQSISKGRPEATASEPLVRSCPVILRFVIFAPRPAKRIGLMPAWNVGCGVWRAPPLIRGESVLAASACRKHASSPTARLPQTRWVYARTGISRSRRSADREAPPRQAAARTECCAAFFCADSFVGRPDREARHLRRHPEQIP